MPGLPIRGIATALGLTSVIAAGPLVAAPAAPSVATKPIPDNASRLSALLNPADRMVQVGMKAFDAGVDSALKKSPEDAAVYTQNPGLLEAVLDAGRPVMRKHLETAIPTQQRRFAEFYAQKFSAEEIDQLISFYSTPTGAKVVAAIYEGLDLAKLAEGMDREGHLTLTSSQVHDANTSAVSHLPDAFNAEDWEAVLVFSVTPVHAKLTRLAPEFNQLVADIGNEPDPALDAEIDKAVEIAVKAYFAQKKEKSAH